MNTGGNVGQAWGWRTIMWILVVPSMMSCLAVALLPPAHSPNLGLRERLSVLANPRVRGVLLGTLSVMLPGFLIIAYLPAVLDTSGALVVAAMLAFGFGQVFGTSVVAWLILRRGAPLTLVLAACGVTLAAVLLVATRRIEAGEIAAMTALGLTVGIAMVPQQHRMFALVPAVAPIAMGLNGSAIYLSVALAAAAGGGVLTVAGTAALGPTAVGLGLLAVIASLAVRPERHI